MLLKLSSECIMLISKYAAEIQMKLLFSYFMNYEVAIV